jgi:hypothetical protein
MILCAGFFLASQSQTNPALANLPDNTWLQMNPVFNPAGLDFNGFGHPKTESKLVFDEKDSVAVWFGGCSNGYTNSTWLYSVTRNTWTRANDLTFIQGGVETEGGDIWIANKDCNSLPHGQCHYSITYDADSGVCIKHTGIESGWVSPDMNTWSYDAGLKKWTKLIAMGSGNASIQSLAYDRENHRAILYGCLSGYCGSDASTTYAFNMATKTWTNRLTSNPPSARGWTATAYHQKLKKTVLFGGAAYNGPVMNDTWLYDYAANTWTQIFPSNPPPARTRGAMAYDSRNEVMIMTCGNDTFYGAGSNAGTWFHDTWVLDLTKNTWTDMKPALQPVCGEKTWQPAYDPANNVMVVVDQGSLTWVYRYKNAGSKTEIKNAMRPGLKLDIFPNPVNSVASIAIKGSLPSGSKLRVYDVRGKAAVDLTEQVRNNRVAWNTVTLPPAWYLVKLESKTRTIVSRVLVVK